MKQHIFSYLRRMRIKSLTFFGPIALAFLIGLTGCVTNPSLNNVTPIYQGMTIERPLATLSHKLEASGDTGETGASEGDVDIDDEDIDEDEIEVDIEDIIEIDVETTDSVKYFVVKNETFRIALNIYNPSQFEILSFTINGYKYANNMFAPGSNLTKVLVEVTASDESGIFDYTVDAIKYVDGTDIKDVRMDGEKTIKTAIRYDEEPTVQVVSQSVGTKSLSLNLFASDPNGLIGDNLFKFYLSNGLEIVFEKDLVKGANQIELNNLIVNKAYQYAVKAVYDVYDGNGLLEKTLVKEEYTTLNGVMIDNVEVGQEEVSFFIRTIEASATIDSITLHEVTEGYPQVAATDIDNLYFGNLLSNHDYYLAVKFSYTTGEKVESDIEVIRVKTLTKATPTIAFSSVQSETESLSFALAISDLDAVGEVTSVKLLKAGVKVGELTYVEGTNTFSNLLSNTAYTIEVKYTYNLNDGVGNQVITITREVRTLTKTTPEVTIFDVSSTQTSISFNIDVVDGDNVGSISKIELYKGLTLIDTYDFIEAEWPDMFVFENLLSNNLYTIRVTYAYDLNDGTGPKTLVTNQNILTLSKATPEVSFANASTTTGSASFALTVNDLDAVGEVTSVKLFKEGVETSQLTYVEGTNTFSDLLSNNDYTIEVKYTYDLNDGVGNQVITITREVRTLTKATPEVTIFDVTSTQTSISFDIDVLDIHEVGNISKIELYQNTTLAGNYDFIEAEWPNYFVFENLQSNTLYTIKVSYSYDLNDGFGEQRLIISNALSTLPIVPTISKMEVINSNLSTGDLALIQITITNPDSINVKSVDINNIDVNVEIGSTLTILNVKYLITQDGGNVDISLNTFTLKNGLVLKLNSPYVIKCFVFGNIYVEDVYLQNLKNYSFQSDVFIIKLFNPSHYEIESININNIEYSKNLITIIDNDRFATRINFNATSMQQVLISSISFSIDGALSIKSMNYQKYFTVVTSVQEVYTSQDLLSIISEPKAYILQNDIDMSGITWQSKDISGVFDGNGFVISNLRIFDNSPILTEAYGLFKDNTGTVQNLTLQNIYYSISKNNHMSVGGIVANNYGFIIDSHVSGTIDVTLNTTNNLMLYVGGISGYSSGLSKNALISLSSSSLSISVNSISKDAAMIGGIVGRNQDNSTIINSLSNSLISVSTEITNNTTYIGGLVGYNYNSNIFYSLAVGEIMLISNSSYVAIGGLSGGVMWSGYYNSISFVECKDKIALIGMKSDTDIVENSYIYDEYGMNEIENISIANLNDKNFFISILGWSESNWNLESLDFLNDMFPTLN